jgi:hypothetical protein
MAYSRQDQYLDTFLGTSFNDEDSFGMGANSNSASMTYVPGTGSVTNMTLGNPNNPDTRYNPKAIAANNLTNNNANIDAAYSNNPYSVDVVAQRRPQTKTVDIMRSQPSLEMRGLDEVNQVTDTYKKLMPMGDTTADDLISKYKPGIVSDRFIEEMARNNIGAGTFSEKGADLAWESSKSVTAPTLDSLNKDSISNIGSSNFQLSEVEVPEQLGQSLGSKIGEKAESFMTSEFASKALAFSPLLGAVSNYKAQGEAIKNLESAKSDAMSAMSGLAESREADFDSTREQYSEDVRRVGALENEIMGERIKKIASAKTGGLVSGTQTEMTEDTIDQSRTKTNISIAKLQDERAATEARLLSANKQERQKLNQTISQLDAKIKEAKREQTMGPVKAAIDVGSNLLMASNPALAIGMQVGKSLIS